MKKRESLVEKFSTFLNFNNSSDPRVNSWKINSRLANNMSRLCNLEPEAKEEFWAQYWLQEALKENSSQLALGHISAYLEETCYWIAITKEQKFVASDFTGMDYLQLVRASVAEPARLFAKYDPTRSSLKTYAQLKLGNEIFEIMRMGREKIKYSDAGLLRSLTKKLLKESLQKAGVTDKQLLKYLLAWNCFKEIYTPTKPAGSQRLEWV